MPAARPSPDLITDQFDRPVIIAHRGASGYLPEHTLPAYELAIKLGADYVEPDLVSTSDGVLVARHENEISVTTDVASHPEFADRLTTKVIDGRSVTGWFSEDFTIAELKTLRARERIPALRPDNTTYDGRYEIPTLDEIIELVRGYRRGRRRVGIYPETKHPSYFASIGLPLEPVVAHELRRHRMAGEDAPVFLQSFEAGSLRTLAGLVDVPLIQLLGERSTATEPADLAAIAEYADGIGPAKELIVPANGNGVPAEPTSLVDDAHAAGLLVHPFTFRAENNFRPPDYRIGPDPAAHGDLARELTRFYELGVDAVFCDFPDVAAAARIRFLFGRSPAARHTLQPAAAAY